MRDIRRQFGIPATRNQAAVIVHVAAGTTRSTRIAEATGMNRRTVQLVLQRLQELGLAEREEEWTPTGRCSRWGPRNQGAWQTCLLPDAVALLQGVTI